MSECGRTEKSGTQGKTIAECVTFRHFLRWVRVGYSPSLIATEQAQIESYADEPPVREAARRLST